MYTIKEAAARSGVSVPVLRAWERRYRIVEPARTAAGYRLYDDEALERIRTMRRLVGGGWTPSTAASAILSDDPLALAAGRPPTNAQRGVDPAPPDVGGDLIEAFVAAAVALDVDAIEVVLDRMLGEGSFERVADTVLLPALTAVGDAWADGRLGVAGEHAASHAALRRLAAAYQAAGRQAPRDGAILVGLPPTVRHELGALAFSTAARRAMLPVLYLGPDLPVEDWVASATATRARAAVIGVVTVADVRPAVEVGAALRAANPDLMIAFGGRSAGRAGEVLAADPRFLAGSSGRRSDPPVILPEPLRDAVRTVEDALARRA
ncbi:MAG TPA: MerR family transcriptional regulator [Patescibacteria group bacterium]|nr:MerR family transcriptional regulator [Patescibacteria group bacterium]